MFYLFVFQENIKVEVVEKPSGGAKTEDKMPLYPHSILKKPKEAAGVGVVKAAKPDVVARDEPVETEGDVFDRPAAQPGKSLKQCFPKTGLRAIYGPPKSLNWSV